MDSSDILIFLYTTFKIISLSYIDCFLTYKHKT